MQETTKPFIITRTIDAPRDLVWQAWTDRERLMEWFGPKGFKMTVAKLDLRPGGMFLYGLRTPDGNSMWGKFVYREIVPQSKIVLVNSFSDENGGTTRHPWNPNWPLELLAKTTFVERDGKTDITIEWTPLNPAPVEKKSFDESHESMKMGWTGTLDQLTGYLGCK